jgi:hypothetical protein
LRLDQADHGHRFDRRIRAEDDAAALRAEFELADAERRRGKLERSHREQLFHGIGQQAEAVDHLDLEFAQFFVALALAMRL